MLASELPLVRADGLILARPQGALVETLAVVETVRSGELVMPFTFKQSLPAVTLSALAEHLPELRRTTCLSAGGTPWVEVGAVAKAWFARGVDVVVTGNVPTRQRSSDWTTRFR